MAYTVTENGSSFDRGVAAGEIAQRLKEHDKHFDKINGSMGDVAVKLAGVQMQLQRIADAMTANEATVIKTAQALKDAEEARRDLSETRWSPVTRVSVIIGIMVGLATIVVVVAGLIH